MELSGLSPPTIATGNSVLIFCGFRFSEATEPWGLIAMSEFLLYYRRPDPTTWVYMSSFLTIGLFFVFRRFWSIRNLDIALLILLAPGLLMVNEGYRRQ